MADQGVTDALKAATLGAQQIQSPDSPLGASSAPELAKMYQSSFQLPQSSGGASALTNIAQQQVAEAKAQQAAAEKAAQDAKDPSKYQRVQKQDGGYAFFDPTGKEISASQYAQILGVSPDRVLADSNNPIDLAFQQDYKSLQQYFQDKINSKFDQTAADRAAQTEKAVKDAYGIDLAKQNHADVVNTFMQSYPTVFGLTTTGKQGTNALLPSYNQSFVDATGTSGSIGG